MSKRSGAQIGKKAFIQSLVILLLLMIAAGLLTLVLPAGSYARIAVDGREQLVPDSFSFTEAPSYPWWRWFIAPLEVLGGPDGLTVMVILAFILVVGAAFAVMDKSGILEAVLARIVRRFEGRKYLLLVVSRRSFPCCP